MEQMRKLPIGIQTFEKLREESYLYVDKTAIIYQIVSGSILYFLSRPRRFGKSLLISTFEAYFEGRKELFEGLAIEKLETRWEQYPVLHLDLNAEKYDTKEALEHMLSRSLSLWEERWGSDVAEISLSARFSGIIRRAYERTGKQAVVLIDEYDKPLLQAILNEPLLDEYRRILKAFYGVLKSSDRYLRFVFLTGVTKFAQVSVFSDLNQLNDISLDFAYATLCGITKEELGSTFFSNCRFAENLLAVDADIKLYIIALNSHLADFFTCQDILKFHDIQNLTKNIILITFDSIRHEIRVHDRENIICNNSLGNHGVSIHILHCKTLHSFLITITRCCDQISPVFGKLSLHPYSFLILL